MTNFKTPHWSRSTAYSVPGTDLSALHG